MDEERVEVTNSYLFFEIAWQWEIIMIRFIKYGIEPAKQFCHSEVNAPVTKIDGGIYHNGC